MLERVLGVALGGLALASSSFAQCAQWDTRFASYPPGTNGNGVAASVVFDDGSGPALFAAGSFTLAGDVAANSIAKWNGTTWSALGLPGSGTNNPVLSLALFDDGTGPALFAAGHFGMAGGISAGHIAKWNGTSWSALAGSGNGTNGDIYCLSTFDDGTGPALFAGGLFTLAGGVPVTNIAKWDGSGWSAVGAPGVPGIGTVYSLAGFDDGTGPALYAGGAFTAIGGVPANHLARWDGANWAEVGGGLDAQATALLSFDDGSGPALYVGGAFTTAGGVGHRRIAKWDGSSWSALGSGMNSGVASLRIFDEGSGPKLYAGGGFTVAGGVTANRIATWDGVGWSSLGTGLDANVASLTPFDDGSGPALFVGGSFSSAGGAAIRRAARWSRSTWSSVEPAGSGLDDRVDALTVFDDGSGPGLVAGGHFTQAGSTPAYDVARWDGANWSALGFGMDDGVRALAVFDDGSGSALYAGGLFTHAGAPANRIAKWDGTSWSALGTGMNEQVLALAVFDDGSGSALYAGGAFTTAGGASAARIAKWDGTRWSTLGTGMANTVFALEVFDDGSGPALFAGGAFATAGGAPASCIAKWNGTSWSPLGTGMNNLVFALRPFDDGSGPALFAAGRFTTAGGVPANRVAKWNGSSWSAPGSGTSGDVNALTIFDDGSGPALFVAGAFTTAGGASANRIAKWNGTNWSSLGSGLDLTGSALAVFDDGSDGDADLYAGGQFLHAGGIASVHFAEWHGCPPAPVPFCFGDGSLAACPCANNGLAGHGCDNSIGTGGALLTSSGTASPDTLVLTQIDTLASSLSIFSQGSAQLGAPVAFGDGLRCIGGALKRLYAKSAVAGTASAPQPGDSSISQRSAELGDPLVPGMVRYYYVYYRDPSPSFCASPAGNTFNAGNALRVAW